MRRKEKNAARRKATDGIRVSRAVRGSQCLQALPPPPPPLLPFYTGDLSFFFVLSITRPLLRPRPRRHRRGPRRCRCAPRLVMESTRDIVARIYGEYQGSASCLYYADDSAIWAIHCESFKNLYAVGTHIYIHGCAVICYYIAY